MGRQSKVHVGPSEQRMSMSQDVPEKNQSYKGPVTSRWSLASVLRRSDSEAGGEKQNDHNSGSRRSGSRAGGNRSGSRRSGTSISRGSIRHSIRRSISEVQRSILPGRRPSLSPEKAKAVAEIKQFEQEFIAQTEDGRRKETRMRRMAEFAMRSYTYTIVSLLLVNVSVFGNEVGLLIIPKKYDYLVQIFLLVALMFFLLDMATLCYIRSDYFNSAVFWLDLVSIISMLPDVGFINDWLVSALSLQNADNSVSISRFAATAARTGSRLSKSLRLIRMLRVVRMVNEIIPPSSLQCCIV